MVILFLTHVIVVVINNTFFDSIRRDYAWTYCCFPRWGASIHNGWTNFNQLSIVRWILQIEIEKFSFLYPLRCCKIYSLKYYGNFRGLTCSCSSLNFSFRIFRFSIMVSSFRWPSSTLRLNWSKVITTVQHFLQITLGIPDSLSSAISSGNYKQILIFKYVRFSPSSTIKTIIRAISQFIRLTYLF